MLVCTYWTDDSYKKYAMALKASCWKYGLEFFGTEVPDKGSWSANLAYKPTFIQLALDTRQDDILWVDSDAIFRDRPSLLLDNQDFDVGAYYNGVDEPWGGTLFFRNNTKARFVLKRWTEFVEEMKPDSDQDALKYALVKSTEYRIMRLPPAYCWVDRIFRRRYSGGTPIIEHFAQSLV